MTNRFLISVAAAALIAGTGFANAQGMNREGSGAAGGAATQQTAPSSERAAPSGAMNHDSAGTKGAESSGTKGSEKSGMKAESNEKMPAAKSAQDTRPDTKGEKSKSISSENDSAKGGKDMKAEGRDSKSGTTAAEGRDSKSGTTNAAEGSKTNGNMNAQTKTGADTKAQTTTGNAATSATAAPPAEKRTQIVSAIKSEKIEETTNVNFNISVGATVPGTVRFHPLPARIVEIYPEWRGYDVIFVHGRYIIVRPQTHEIVYIIEG
ncbi:DUF1236 domain-containing protein [Afipia sp. GAS231]|uniref:DUF1236 domain-containing protein n=1 Tax=Afipia sp. GAS231 TaxID=1882747 RepID=UPI000879B611|nr:DUF1236 domain-containing protein [Afipia sp. GAS231]SDP44287.1 Protein of unknown function [Afipia sp. GAS231]